MTGRERYAKYLQSQSWKSLARAARERANQRCEFCGGSPDHVHHVRYPRDLAEDEIGNLIVLCESCHSKSHGIRGREMSDAMVLNFENRRLVAAIVNGETLFRFRDVFDAIEYEEMTKTYNAINNQFLPNQVYASAWGRLPDKCKREVKEELDGTDRVVRYVTKNGVYRMAMNSTSAAADRFQDWVADVCESIRVHGCYPPPEETKQQLTPAWLMVEQAKELARLDDEQREIIKRQKELESRQHELGECAKKLDARLNAIDSDKEQNRKAIEDALNLDRFTSRQRLIIRGIDPEMDYRGEPLKTVVGRLASNLGREKRVSPEKIMEGTYKVNVWPAHIIDDAIRSLGLLPSNVAH